MKRKRSDDIEDPTSKLRAVVRRRDYEREMRRKDAADRIPEELRTRIYSHLSLEEARDAKVNIDCRYWTQHQTVKVQDIERDIEVLSKCWDKVIITVTPGSLNLFISLLARYPVMKSIVNLELSLLDTEDQMEIISQAIFNGNFRSLKLLWIYIKFDRLLPTPLFRSLMRVAKIESLRVALDETQLDEIAEISVPSVTTLVLDIRSSGDGAPTDRIERMLINTFPKLKELHFGRTDISDVLVLRNRTLTTVYASQIPCDQLDVSNLTALEYLEFEDPCDIIDLSSNQRLKILEFTDDSDQIIIKVRK